MKPHHYLLIGITFGLVLGALTAIYLRNPCPELPTVEATPAGAARATQRDSIDTKRDARAPVIDSLKATIKNPDHEKSKGIVTSRSDQQWLDSLKSARP